MTSWGLVFVGGLSLANLLFLALLARKVRHLAARAPAPFSSPWLSPGERVRDFAAATTDGRRVALQHLLGRHSLVAFFSTGCRPCQEQVPVFAQQAGEHGAALLMLAVIVGPRGECADYLAMLEGKAMVVQEDRRGPVTTAFATNAFPGVYLVSPEGTVIARGPSVAAIAGRALSLVDAR